MEKSLAHRLRDARKMRGLTQVQLANASGIKQSDVSKIERGETLRPTGLIQLAQALQVSPNWLATGDGEMVPTMTTANVKWTGAAIDGQEPDDYDQIENWLQLTDAIKSKLAPTLQGAGREQLVKYITGEISQEDALNTLSSLVDVSYGLLKRSQG